MDKPNSRVTALDAEEEREAAHARPSGLTAEPVEEGGGGKARGSVTASLGPRPTVGRGRERLGGAHRLGDPRPLCGGQEVGD